MNAAHAHLLINHVAPLATLLALPLLMLALLQRSSQHTLRAAALILLVASIASISADVSGDAAEDLVEAFPAVQEDLLHLHKDAAERAMPLGVLLGLAALALTYYDGRSNGTHRTRITALLLLAAVVSAFLMTGAAYTGGHIRHPEARPGFELKQLTEPPYSEIEAL